MADIFEIVGKVTLDGMDKAEKDLRGFSDTGEQSASKLSKLGSIAGSIGKGLLIGTGVVATGAVALVKQVSSSYGELQQSIGGIETLFGESAQKVIDNANNAYTTAGISANEYMQQVTSFSASLLQSLGGDTEAAASAADMAVRDMADNANKMGTSMEMIQNAYQGFSKQNYTMLDNLKLGYGGTKTEMERLLADAEKITGIKYDISNLNDVYSAIHVIQQELGITGTTALEAGATIEGSFNSLSASWQNFIAGLGNPDADMAKIIDNLAKGLSGAINNVTPIIDNMVAVLPTVMDSIITTVGELAPTFINTFTELVTQVINAIIPLLPTVIPLFVDMIVNIGVAIIENAPILIDGFIQLITQLTVAISENLPTLIPVFIECIVQIANAIIANSPIILDAILSIGSNFSEGLSPAINACVALIEVLTTAFIAFKAGAMIQNVINMWQTAQVTLALYSATADGATVAQGFLNGTLTLGETIVGLFTGQVTLAELATGLWSKAQVALNAALTANPIGVIVMAIAAIIAIIVVAYNHSETFRNFINNLWEDLKVFGAWIAEGFVACWNGLVEFFTVIIPSICEGVITFINGFIQSVKDFFINGWNSIVQFFTVGIPTFIESIITFFNELPYKIGYILGSVVGSVANFVVNLKDKAIELGSNFIYNITTFFTQLPERILTFCSNAKQVVYNWAVEMTNKAIEIGTNFVDGIINFVKELPSRISTFCNNVLQNVMNWSSNLKNKAVETGTTFLNSIINFIKELPNKFSNWLVQTLNEIIAWGNDLIQKGAEIGQNVSETIVNGIKNLPNTMLDIGKNLVTGLWNGVTSLGSWLKTQISNFGKGVIDGFKNTFKINSPSKVMAELGTYITQGLGVGIADDDSAEKAIDDKVNNIINRADNVSLGVGINDMITESPLQKYQFDFNAQISALNDGFDRLIDLVGAYLPNISNNMNRPLLVDGNNLASSISRQMDTQLGRMAVSKGRGNV